MKNNRKSIGYLLVMIVFSAFGLVIYGAYSPARKSQFQQIVCVKFKKELREQAILRQMNGFAALKPEIKQIVSYSAGRTVASDGGESDYDVMHYLTFRSEADAWAYRNSVAYKAFEQDNRDNWEKVLVIDSQIQQ